MIEVIAFACSLLFNIYCIFALNANFGAELDKELS